MLFTFARTAHEFRQLRAKVGEEPEESSAILDLGLRGIRSEYRRSSSAVLPELF